MGVSSIYLLLIYWDYFMNCVSPCIDSCLEGHSLKKKFCDSGINLPPQIQYIFLSSVHQSVPSRTWKEDAHDFTFTLVEDRWDDPKGLWLWLWYHGPGLIRQSVGWPLRKAGPGGWIYNCTIIVEWTIVKRREMSIFWEILNPEE